MSEIIQGCSSQNCVQPNQCHGNVTDRILFHNDITEPVILEDNDEIVSEAAIVTRVNVNKYGSSEIGWVYNKNSHELIHMNCDI